MTFRSIFVLVCTMVLIYGGDAELPTQSTIGSPDQLAKEAFDLTGQAQKAFNFVLNPTGSSQKVNKKKDHLDQPDAQLTEPNAQLLGQIKTSLLDGSNSYFTAEQSIREWCSYAQTILKAYIELLQRSNHSHESAKKLFSALLDHAIKSYSNGQRAVHDMSSAFAKASSQLKKIIVDLEKDYDEHSESFEKRLSQADGSGGSNSASGTGGGGLFNGWFDGGADNSVRQKRSNNEKVAKLKAKLQIILNFYVNLNKDVENALNEFVQVNSLEEQIKRLTNLKAQIDRAPAGQDGSELTTSAKALNALCEEYIQGHV